MERSVILVRVMVLGVNMTFEDGQHDTTLWTISEGLCWYCCHTPGLRSFLAPSRGYRTWTSSTLLLPINASKTADRNSCRNSYSGRRFWPRRERGGFFLDGNTATKFVTFLFSSCVTPTRESTPIEKATFCKLPERNSAGRNTSDNMPLGISSSVFILADKAPTYCVSPKSPIYRNLKVLK